MVSNADITVFYIRFRCLPFVLAIVLCSTGCPFLNQGNAPDSKRGFSATATAQNLRLSNSTGTPPSRTAYWGTITISDRDNNTLMTITEAAVTLYLNAAGQCAATFQGNISANNWNTSRNYNGQPGQGILIRLHNDNDGSIQKYQVGYYQVRCTDQSIPIDQNPVTFDGTVYKNTTSVEFVVQPFFWVSCDHGKQAVLRPKNAT